MMPLYLVTVPVSLETYAHTAEDAAAQVRAATRADSRIAAPAPGVPMFGDAAVHADPARNGGRIAPDAPTPTERLR